MTASIRLATLVVFTISVIGRTEGGHEVVVGFTDLSGVTTASPGSTVYITVGVLEGKLEKNETVKLLLISGPGSVIVNEDFTNLHRPIELTMEHPQNTSKVVIRNSAHEGTVFPLRLTTPETDSTGDVEVTLGGFFNIKITDVPQDVRINIAYLLGFAAVIGAVGGTASIIYFNRPK